MADLANDPMMHRLEAAERRYRELEDEVGRPVCVASPAKLREVSQELAALRAPVATYREFRSIGDRLATGRDMCADPDPDIRARRQPGAARRAASAPAMAGARARAGASRSFRWAESHARKLPKSGARKGVSPGFRVPPPEASREKTCAVGTEMPGLTSTRQHSGKTGSGVSFSPIPCIR